MSPKRGDIIPVLRHRQEAPEPDNRAPTLLAILGVHLMKEGL